MSPTSSARLADSTIPRFHVIAGDGEREREGGRETPVRPNPTTTARTGRESPSAERRDD